MASRKKAPSPRPTAREQSRIRRLALLLELEIRRIVEDVRLRRGLLLTVWSRLRKRGPLLRTLQTRYTSLTAEDLLLLPTSLILLLDRFYRTVDEFYLYLESTEDMPTTLLLHYDHYLEQMDGLAPTLLATLSPLHGESPEYTLTLAPGELMDEVPLPPVELEIPPPSDLEEAGELGPG